MQIFVTGGAGFIGSHLCLDLLKKGHKVTAYDNLLLGKEALLLPCKAFPEFSFFKRDLRSDPELSQLLHGTDLVFHLAANSDIQEGAANTHLDLDLNLTTTYNLLEAMRQAKVKQLAFASTSAIYGEAATRPTPESFGPLKPISYYGASKLAAESFVSAFAHNAGMKTWIFRFANIVGQNLTHGAIYDFVSRLQANSSHLNVLGDGTQQKSYLHVQDCIDGMQFAIQNISQECAIFNLASQGTSTVRFIAESVVQRMKLNCPIRYGATKRGWAGDVPFTWLDGSLLSQAGWTAQLKSDEAVLRCIDEYLSIKGIQK